MTTTGYGGSEELYNDGIAAYDAVLGILEEIDTALSRQSGPGDCPVTPATYSFYCIKILFDVVRTKIYLMEKIIGQEKPDQIIAFLPRNLPPRGIMPFTDDESVCAQLLALEGWKIPVQFVSTEQALIPVPVNREKESIISTILKNSTVFNLAILYKRKGLRSLASVAPALLHKKAPVVIYGSGYNWDDALAALYSAGFNPIMRYHPEGDADFGNREKDLITRIEAICRQSSLINERAMVYGIDTRPVLFKKMSIILARTCMESVTAYQQFNDFLHARNPKCLLLSTQAYHVDRAIVKAAQDYGIPVISWQHGCGGYCFHPMMPFAEFIDSDLHLVFGEGVKAGYTNTSQRMGIQKPPEFVPVGSSSLDHLARTYHEKNPAGPGSMVLYVTTLFLNNTFYLSDRPDQCTYDETLWRTQKTILDFAGKNPHMPFVVKLFPSHKKDSPVHRYASDAGIRNVTFVIGEKTIAGLIEEAGMIIFDINSTGLLQALHSKKPVFVFTGLENHDPDTLCRLKKRAFVYDTHEALIRGIGEFLGPDSVRFVERSGVDYSNTEFLMEYGTFRNDGKSALRAADIVKERVTADRSPSR
ncbi:MAG: hypothetical protein PHT99_02160 [Methanoregula sp.]|nr:hypothetical protein [Methanoregula sp.]